MIEITAYNFHHEQKEFLRRDGSKSFLMIRPDRPFDPSAHRYPDGETRRKGLEAKEAWFEYLAAKGFFKTLKTWRAILESGRSVMVVCADPLAFDLKFVPPPRLANVCRGRELDCGPVERERILRGFGKLHKELRASNGQPRVSGWSSLGEVEWAK